MSKRAGKSLILIVIALAALGAGLFYWVATRGLESTDDAAIESNIIPVAPRVAGYILELDVKDNQPVKKGDILLKIDPRDYRVALESAEADLSSAESKLAAAQYKHTSTTASAPSMLTSARTQVDAAEAAWKNAQATLKRLQTLNDQARSRQSLDDAAAAEKSARSKLEGAQAMEKAAETAPDIVASSAEGVKDLEAAVLKAKAAVEMAQNNLDDTTLVAPLDGRVTRRTVEMGGYVQPGQQLMTVVGNDLWIVANFKETQLTYMRSGQKVDINIDAYPGKSFSGKVDSLQAGSGARFSLFPAENATGNFVKVVQRVPVKIIFDERPGAEFPVGPGMSVVPTVHVR